jgi:hypothetical protein
VIIADVVVTWRCRPEIDLDEIKSPLCKLQEIVIVVSEVASDEMRTIGSLAAAARTRIDINARL